MVAVSSHPLGGSIECVGIDWKSGRHYDILEKSGVGGIRNCRPSLTTSMVTKTLEPHGEESLEVALSLS